MFEYKYLSKAHLNGLQKYKYSAIDTSPLSNYVMHPSWNTIVKIIPNNIAPNLLTFAGFLCMVVVAILFAVFDYNCFAAGKPAGYDDVDYSMPNWVYTVAGVLLFLAYNLDGVDGKQARKIGVSGPLGELFDHGLDSYIVFLIPYAILSIYGRDSWSLSVFRGFTIIMSVVLNFYVSHWEKYNTGTLYLPWGYDVSMWATSLLFLVAGAYGPSVYKYHIFLDYTFLEGLEIVVHATGLFTTLPIAIYNVYTSRNRRRVLEMLRPLWSMTLMTALMTWWALHSPSNVIERDPRVFIFLYGTLFSSIAGRLIVAEICNQRCEAVCWLFWPLASGVTLGFLRPQLELPILYALAVVSVVAHVHYGVCVVRQICAHLNISCFTVPPRKVNSKKK